MKRCPQCGTTYTDETLRFCLADGTSLTSVGESEPTLAAGHRDQLRVDTPTAQTSNVRTPEAKRSSGPWFKILAAIIVLGFVGVVVVAFAGFLLYYSTAREEPASVTKTPTPSPAVSPTPDSDKQKLEDELANLQKKIEEQTKSTNSDTQPFPVPDVDDNSIPKARVNSPNDGFLALRNVPSVEHGELIMKIPHGDSVDVIYCDETQLTISGRKGKWCLVTYGNNAGFVFDAFLVY